MSSEAPHQLRVFTFVAQTEILLVWIFYSVLLGVLLMIPAENYIALLAGALWIVIGIPFLRYGFIIIELTARGHSKIPRMDSDVFSLDGRVYKLLLWIAIALLIHSSTPVNFQWISNIVLALVTPAIVSFITFNYPFVQALNPLNIWSFMSNMGLSYSALKFLGIWLLAGLTFLVSDGLRLYDSNFSIFLNSATIIYLLLVMFRATGVLLHFRRNQLGLQTDFSQEQRQQKQQQKQQLAQDKLIKQAHKLSRAGKYLQAFKLLNRYLKRGQYADEAAVFDALCKLEDPRLARKIAQGYIGRLLVTDRNKAWQIFDEIWADTSGNYKLDSGALVLEMAATAVTSQQKYSMLALLKQFDRDFPAHPRSREAALCAVEYHIEFSEIEQAEALLEQLATNTGKIDTRRLRLAQEFIANQ